MPVTRSLLLTVHHLPGPLGGLREVLHTAVGLASGLDGHRVEVILVGDGVLHGLREHETPGSLAYLAAARVRGIRLFVDERSLQLRGLNPGQICEAVAPIGREIFQWKLNQTDLHLRI